MKPLGFTLEEMADLLGLLDGLAAENTPADRAALLDRLTMYREAAGQRIDALQEHLDLHASRRTRTEP